MSWVHQHHPTHPTSNHQKSTTTPLLSSTSSSSSKQQTFNINVSSSNNPSVIQQKQVSAAAAAPPPLRSGSLAQQPSSSSLPSSLALRTTQSSNLSSALANNSTLLMTSQQHQPQYSSQKSTNLLTNSLGTRMRLNNAAGPPPYQQQQQQQQHVHAPTSQANLGHHHATNNNNNPMPLNQGAPYQNQQNSWQNLQTATTQNYLSATKMIPQQATQPPMPPAMTGASGNTTNAKNWQHNYQNSNVMYQQQQQQQQQQPQPLQQQWPQQQQQQQNPGNASAATYDNLFNHVVPQAAQQQQVSNAAYQQQQQQPTPAAASYFQQTTAGPVAPGANAVNFFDNANNNQSNTGGGGGGGADGWGDWDWNDNSTIDANGSQNVNESSQQQQQPTTLAAPHPPPASAVSTMANDLQHHPPPPPSTAAQIQANNSNIIADSFNQPQNNDSWNWNASNDNEQHIPTNEPKLEQQQHNDNWNWNTSNDMEQPATNDHSNDNWNWQTNENQQQLTTNAASQQQPSLEKPPTKPTEIQAPVFVNQKPENPIPIVQMATSTAVNSENYNYNSPASQAMAPSTNNIPNTVFVSQAKPVTLPSRQYASPPMGNTPVSENPPETALMPPQAFQNTVEEPPATTSRPANVQTPSLPGPPPTLAAPPGMPPAVPPASATSAAAGNPFKRSGLAQHHRASGLMATTAPPAVVPPAPMAMAPPSAFNMPAPPPPADFANPSAAAITLMEPENNEMPLQENQEILTPPVGSITLPNAGPQNSSTTSSNQTAPPNDERNQYLQTSHLSENSEEQSGEADGGLLPPPGLSRLVLGEPELEASQRMVMGTEAHTATVAAPISDVMHLEERHADGEDTASETAAPNPDPSSSNSTTDRNFYMVPGESNAANQQQLQTPQQQQQPQRVVTGVELQEQREIEMDGENLEDQQQPQHQVLSPEARNEPPVEGADETIDNGLTAGPNNPVPEPMEIHAPPSSKPKDNHPISSPNDEDDSDERLLNDRASSSKSRSKFETERHGASSSSRRRRDKRSMQRYDSEEEYLNSEDGGEYSSDREERERRERNSEQQRRRNYREGSVRSDRGGDEEDNKRSRRQPGARDKRDKYYYDEERSRGVKSENRRQRQRGGGGYENDSRYETEESTRFDARKESSRRSMRHPDSERRGERRHQGSDQGGDYDDYQRRGGYRSSKRSGGDNYESDRRERRRDDYDTVERRRRSDKHRDPRYRVDDPRYDPREYEEYRKHSSRNARESDLEKEQGGPGSRRMLHDPRHAAAAMYGGYPSAGGYYDPYTAYYYQQMARTNPQAYAEWYKKYYGQHAGAGAGAVAAGGVAGVMPAMPGAGETAAATGNDGRESVHSGRSSAHNDMVKDRYTHAYITQANEYHRHYHQQQQQQHHHQQQHQLHYHHHQQQQQMAFNQTHNSTMLDEDSLNQSTSLYSGIGIGGGGPSRAHSQTNLSQIHGGYYVTPTVAAAAAMASGGPASAMYYARSDYAESRSGARDPDPIATEPQRLTPCKFINEHAVVSFGSGLLVTVKPKYTPHGHISNIVKLLKFKPNDETRKLFKVFPGPLVRGLTHKKTVIEFCQEQIRLGPMETTIYAKQLISNNAEKYRGSYTLMWNLLILLLKQNGMVVGTDIAELLLKNQQQFAYQTPSSTLNNSLKSKSGANSPVATAEQEDPTAATKDTDNPEEANPENPHGNEDHEENRLDSGEDEAKDEATKAASSTLTDSEITEKFRNYLLYGNVNEALDWATDNNLWGHALFLASKLDRRSHANVMMKFANKLALNDPLQTLYQLMSGRTPSSVTCVQDEKWGDWRPHLSMILSNTSQKPELDRKAITTLGDSLFNRGDLYAAHFCYLMAQVNFGRYQESATQETSLQQHLPKLVLLGSSHYKQFQDFAHNEAIIMTEIYEYACSLNDEKFSITEFQPYKFLLATRLLDYGFHLKSLMYLEQIAVHIARDPSKYEGSFINKVYELADRLKYYDPVLEKTIDDQQQQGQDEAGDGNLNQSQQQMEEQKWLQSLRQMAQQYKIDCGLAVAASSALSAPGTTLMDGQQQSPAMGDPSYNYQQQQIDQQFMEINKQFSELNLQYQNNNQDATQQQHQQPTFYNPEMMQQNSQPHADPLQQPTSLDPYQQQQNDQSLNQDPQQQQQSLDPQNPNQDLYQQQQQQQSSSYMQPDPQYQSYTQAYYDPSQQHYNNNDPSLDQQTTATDNAAYDYWSQQQQQQMQGGYGSEENARPTISMPKSKTYDTDDETNQAADKQQKGQQKSGGTSNDSKQQQQQAAAAQKNKENKDAKNASNSNQNSGWFGGIWNKFSLKPKNQMILPDDKNPSIVWDPEKKKWVNTDADEQAEEAFKPPPKMGDLMPQASQGPPSQQQQPQPQQPQQQHQSQTQQPQIAFMDPQQYVPTASSTPLSSSQQPQQPTATTNVAAAPNNQNNPAPAKTPTLQSNMFKMQRNRTLKNAYVDVFNPSGAPVNKAAENILAPALPPATVPQSGFFIPGGSGSGPATGNGGQDTSGGYQQQAQDTPQFYNPNQYGAGTGY